MKTLSPENRILAEKKFATEKKLQNLREQKELIFKNSKIGADGKITIEPNICTSCDFLGDNCDGVQSGCEFYTNEIKPAIK